MVMMFSLIALMMIFVIVMRRVRSVVRFTVMIRVRFIVIVNDHRNQPDAPNRIQCDTQHHQYTQGHRAGKPRKVRSLMVR